MSNEAIQNSTKPKKVLHLDTPKEPSLRTLLKFRTKSRSLVKPFLVLDETRKGSVAKVLLVYQDDEPF